MPTKQQNLSNTEQPNIPKTKWNLMPYFLYFLITLLMTFYLYNPFRQDYDGFFLDLRPEVLLLYWGLFIVGCVSYFVIRRLFIKKTGFKYSLFVFLLNPFIILLFVYEEDITSTSPFLGIGFFAFYIFFMFMYTIYLLSRKH